VLVLLAAASFLGWLPRLSRQGSVRRHVEMLRSAASIQQFAPAAYRAFADFEGRLDITIVAHRAHFGSRYELVPVNERALAAWLA
jgi:hypothetical protein